MSEVRNPFFDDGMISERERIITALLKFWWADENVNPTISKSDLIDLINIEVQA